MIDFLLIVAAMTFNLRQIEVFRAVMITGSIRGAAQLLFVSQPAVSRLLSHTESRVGFPLFERIRGRLHATPEAKKLFHEVEQVYAGVKRVNELARDLKEHQEGILNIVSSPSVGQMAIPMAMAQYRRANPQVKLTFQTFAQAPLMERLLNRQADLAVTILPVKHPNLEMEAIGTGSLVCICPHGHPLAGQGALTLQDLLPYPFISYDRATPFGAIVGALFDTNGQTLHAAIEIASPQNACALVHAGAGVALVDEFSARSWLGAKFHIRPVAQAPVLTATLVRLRLEPMSQLAQAFVEVLKDELDRQGLGLSP